MEDEQIRNIPDPEEEGYTPRPRGQVWAARLGLLVFLLFVAYQILTIAFGGFV